MLVVYGCTANYSKFGDLNNIYYLTVVWGRDPGVAWLAPVLRSLTGFIQVLLGAVVSSQGSTEAGLPPSLPSDAGIIHLRAVC